MSGTATLPAGSNQRKVSNGTAMPQGGPRVVPVLLDFTSSDIAIADFTTSYERANMLEIQTIYFDNSSNSFPVTMSVDNTQQTLVIDARQIVCVPMICAIRPKITFVCANATRLVVLFLNVMLPAFAYHSTVAVTPPAPTGAITHTVATGGSAVIVFNPPTQNGGFIVNPLSATESLFVDPVNTPGTSAPGSSGTTTELLPGQSFSWPANTGGIIQVNAATSGHVFTAVGYN